MFFSRRVRILFRRAIGRGLPGAALVSLIGGTIILGGCSTGGVFNYSVPSHSDSILDTPNEIAEVARNAADKYQDRANDNANSTQLFEVPAIAGGVGVVAGAVFRASLREIQAIGLGAAAALAGDQYYSPKQRAKIYSNGSQAMACLATLAGQTSQILYAGTDARGRTPKFSPAFASLVELFTSTATLTTDQRTALQTVIDLPTHSVSALTRALHGVDSSIFNQNLSTLTAPNLQKLENQLTTEIQKSNSTKINATEAVGTNKNVLTSMAVEVAPRETPAQIISSAKYLIDFAADFDKSITQCSTLAGRTS